MKNLLTLAFSIFFVSTISASVLPDTVVQVHGKALDKNSNSPIKVKVEYQSVPYSSISGIITSNESGEFDVYLRGGTKYTFKVSADGYFPFAEELDLMTVNDTKIDKEIMLEGGDAGYVIRLDNLIFEQGSAEITPSSFAELDELAKRLNTYPKMVIQLEGHTDFRGDADANMKLSQDRVRNVRNYILGKGIEGSRVQMRAFGGTQPLSRENTNEARQLNRRVEVRIISVE